MRKVLIANRGEIAVRVARACRDHGLASVAVYAEPDRDAMHVRVSDEAFALGGSTPADSYLDVAKVLKAVADSGADAVHPGYGFLSENADFAQAVLDAGITWIGPPPAAIAALGDKTTARHIALKIGAPLAPGTADPVSGVDEVLTFAKEHGVPVAIKAAFGGGGRGLKIAWSADGIPELFDSAVREAVAAFGRGECFVERYLDKPRHVETQVLADTHGNVVVVSTRDCSLQRRYQKVVEEAPAPFLTEAQREQIYTASKEIIRAAGYVGAGTCEFLVAPDGLVSFLEVNTRLQVEHPVTEEVTGIDLVREQFRIADGLALSFSDPEPRGHSFEFRINGEDPGRGFLPAPGTVTRFVAPMGPGVRVDSGVESGDVIGGAFDSLLAKLIVTGATRTEALERSRRALDEMQVDGMATLLPFHRQVVRDAAFTSEPFTVHNRWIETEFAGAIPPYAVAAVAGSDTGPGERETVVVEVGGRRLEVTLPARLAGSGSGGTASATGAAPRRTSGKKAGAQVSGDALTSPMQGTIVKVAVSDGATVVAGDLIVVLEAMKMEQPIAAHRAGVVSKLTAAVGEVVTSGSVVCEITDPPDSPPAV
ncbi:MAG TPA: biotin carboxylase N-terminal domain-containing protein [Mycobacteriales bacterium]|nr:biotin carboxylase N-terminal domain-containing protein [Mycobacteriales bacterium]